MAKQYACFQFLFSLLPSTWQNILSYYIMMYIFSGGIGMLCTLDKILIVLKDNCKSKQKYEATASVIIYEIYIFRKKTYILSQILDVSFKAEDFPFKRKLFLWYYNSIIILMQRPFSERCHYIYATKSSACIKYFLLWNASYIIYSSQHSA